MMKKSREQFDLESGRLLAARVAVCRHCKGRSEPHYGKTVRKDVVPALKALGWQYRLYGGWHCPECVALKPLQIAEGS